MTIATIAMTINDKMQARPTLRGLQCTCHTGWLQLVSPVTLEHSLMTSQKLVYSCLKGRGAQFNFIQVSPAS